MKVIVGVDGGPQQPSALALGAQLAAAEDDELIVAHAYEWSLMIDRLDAGHAAQLREQAQHLVDGAAAWLGGRRITTDVVADTSIPRALHALAADAQADVLVIGSCHRGAIGRTLVGGTGERLVHGAPCRVAIAPRDFEPRSERPRTIGVAYDESPEARAALAWATQHAEASGASIVVMTAFEPIWVPAGPPGSVSYGFHDLERGQRDEARQRLADAVDALPDSVHAKGHLLEGSPVHALSKHAEGLDLLVMGSRAYGAVRTVLLGGVSHRLVREAPCPLMVLPRSARPAGRDAEADTLAAGG